MYYTNCPLVSASNVDQELGWTKEEYKKIGVQYLYLRSRKENDWYPHYVHNLDNLIRFGGLFPPIHVHADIRRTRLLGVTHAPREGGVMMVRSRDDIYRMADLKGKKIGLSRSQNTIKNDWWGIQEEQGIELMLRLNGMTRKDVADRRVPLPGRLVRQARDDGPRDGEPVGAVAAARPQARPGVPPAGDGAREGRHRRDVHADGPLSQLSEETGSSSRSRTWRGTRTGRCRWPTSRPRSPAPT